MLEEAVRRFGAQIDLRWRPPAFIGPEADDLHAFFAQAEPVVGAVPYEWLAAAIERFLPS